MNEDDENDTIEYLQILVLEALDLAEEGWSYASNYFKDKHEFEARLERIHREAGLL